MVKSTGKSGAASILIVDDDVELTAMLSDYLRGEGFVVTVIHSGAEAVPVATSGHYDAVILDVMLPGLLGVDVLRLIRQTHDIPVIMLTAKGDNLDRVLGLELGADDYVAKPYFPRELVARLRAVLRRRSAWQPQIRPMELTCGDLRVDVEARRARCAGRELELTVSEFNLLVCLLRAAERVASKEMLSREVLGRPHVSYDRSLDMHISHLRQKLAMHHTSIVLETVRGVGYRIGRR